MANSSGNNGSDNSDKLPYSFGGINDFNLEQIENEVLNDSVYLDVFAGSDVRFKEDVKPFSSDALESIAKLNVFNYKYKTSEYPEQNFPEGEVTGLLAQELEQTYPIAVKSDGQDMKYVNYASLAPLLIQAVKDLSEKVEEQGKVIEALEKKLGQ